jgi:hypothetical protein
MTGKDLFGVILRVAGLILSAYALWYLWFALLALGGMTPPKDVRIASYWAFGVPALLVGIYFLRGAPHILRFSYPERPGTSSRKEAG